MSQLWARETLPAQLLARFENASSELPTLFRILSRSSAKFLNQELLLPQGHAHLLEHFLHLAGVFFFPTKYVSLLLLTDFCFFRQDFQQCLLSCGIQSVSKQPFQRPLTIQQLLGELQGGTDRHRINGVIELFARCAPTHVAPDRVELQGF